MATLIFPTGPVNVGVVPASALTAVDAWGARGTALMLPVHVRVSNASLSGFANAPHIVVDTNSMDGVDAMALSDVASTPVPNLTAPLPTSFAISLAAPPVVGTTDTDLYAYVVVRGVAPVAAMVSEQQPLSIMGVADGPTTTPAIAVTGSPAVNMYRRVAVVQQAVVLQGRQPLCVGAQARVQWSLRCPRFTPPATSDTTIATQVIVGDARSGFAATTGDRNAVLVAVDSRVQSGTREDELGEAISAITTVRSATEDLCVMRGVVEFRNALDGIGVLEAAVQWPSRAAASASAVTLRVAVPAAVPLSLTLPLHAPVLLNKDLRLVPEVVRMAQGAHAIFAPHTVRSTLVTGLLRVRIVFRNGSEFPLRLHSSVRRQGFRLTSETSRLRWRVGSFGGGRGSTRASLNATSPAPVDELRVRSATEAFLWLPASISTQVWMEWFVPFALDKSGTAGTSESDPVTARLSPATSDGALVLAGSSGVEIPSALAFAPGRDILGLEWGPDGEPAGGLSDAEALRQVAFGARAVPRGRSGVSAAGLAVRVYDSVGDDAVAKAVSSFALPLLTAGEAARGGVGV